MKRMMVLELKRVVKTRSTWMLAAGALLLSVIMALLVISFARHYYLGENDTKVRLTGRKAIQANQERLKSTEGLLTPEKIRAAFETYHEVYETYGAKREDIPKDIYYQKISPINPILHGVLEVYVDKSTGIPVPLHEIAPEDAATFYEQRTERLADYLSHRYKDAPDVIEKALAINGRIKAPFYYVYGVGDSDTSEYLTMCIFLLVMICTVIAAPIFSADYQSGADDILRCAKHGRWRLAVVKILSAILLTTAVFTVCVTMFILISYAAFGWGSLETTLQLAFSAISFVPLTIGEVNMLVVLSGLLTFLATVCFTLFLSTKFKNPLTTLGLAIAGCLLPTILSFAGSGTNLENWIRLCLPSGGVGLRNSFFFELTEFHFLSLGTINVWTPYIIPVAAGIEIILFITLAIRSYSRNEAY
ncbi:MAG: ABC transporter permease subunit [Firmicutes bacterium]|nr:ABC transporter permease subunit [Bacillota bacterium]